MPEDPKASETKSQESRDTTVNCAQLLKSGVVASIVNAKRGFPWEKCPYEVRDMIFAGVDIRDFSYFRWYGTIPALVVALRGLPTSYEHVLQWFRYRNTVIFLNSICGYSLNELKARELQMLTSLRICLEYNSSEHPTPQLAGSAERSISRPLGIIDLFTKPLLAAVNIRSVTLGVNACGYTGCQFKDQLHFITEFPFWLRGFRSLKTVTVAIPYAPWAVGHDLRSDLLDSLMKRIKKKLGVMAYRRYGGSSRDEESALRAREDITD